MKTAQVYQDKIVIKDVEDIKLDGRKGAIVRVLGCGLCGSDIVIFKHKIVRDGAVLGHEIVAEIIEINSDTDFKSGDKIVIGKKDITLKVRGFDSKSNIRSRNVRIFCVCKENTNKAG